MGDYNRLGLYEHNIRSYEKIKKQFENDNIAAIVHATGTGKSFNALQLALDNKDKKIIYVVPYGSIVEHEKELINQNNNLSLENDFPNLQFRTYQSFINMSRDEISELEVDLLILDEFHHIGAPVWGQRINTIIETHENLQIFGMTAYTVRDRGTAYERDMVNPETDELFSNKVVSNYDLCDAMIEEVLPKPNYKSGYVFLEETYKYLETKVNSLNPNSKDYKDLAPLLRDLKKRVHEAPNLSDIFKINIKPNGKYIYFCPLNFEQGVNDMNSIMSETKKWIYEMGLTKDDYEFYMTTSEMGEEGKKNRDAFYNDNDLKQNDVSNKLRIMFAINQYNEGVHAPRLDGVIMGRSTQSDIVYFEQLGRALSVGYDTKKEYEMYKLKSKDELIEECRKRELTYTDSMSKEEIIEILIAPIIIDLSNNIGFIKGLENDLKDRMKEYQISKNGKKREIHLKNALFNINMINDDLFKTLEYVRDRLTMTWMDKYELAKAYYEYYGDLEVPQNFKTVDGYNYDENGVALGTWIKCQRQAYNGTGTCKITEEQIELLKQIGMRFENKWDKKYELAKTYYEHYGDLEVPSLFKTTDGYNYDESGVALGIWLATQRRAYKGNSNCKITEEQIELLKQIGMQFENKWDKKYELAKAYYEYHGDLEVPSLFKTTDGYNYDESGVALGSWLATQRQAYKGNNNYKITEEQIELLKQIGMRFELKNNENEWDKKYELAKAYYEHYGNLKVPQNFKTVDGYNYDESGVALGIWLATQRQAYKGNNNYKITEEQIELLKQIGMRFELKNNENEWNKKYELAKAYYEYHGDLKIPQNFKTADGYNYDESGVALGRWIINQRQAYKGNKNYKITEERIELLKQIGMRFELKNREDKWNRKYELAKAYYEYHGDLKVPKLFKTTDGYNYDESGVALGIWLATQRQAYKGNSNYKITEEQIELLKQIGMRFELKNREDKWNRKYELAKAYYEYHGNLEIPSLFKTVDGYNYDENGVALGYWIINQRQAYKGNKNYKITEERIELLKQIGMRFEIRNKKHELYHEHLKENHEFLNKAKLLLNKYSDLESLSKEKINQQFSDEPDHTLGRK